MNAQEPRGNPGRLWSRNARAILEIIAELGPVARPELVRVSGLSRTAVTQIVSELAARNAIRQSGIDDSRRGPAAVLYSVVADRNHSWAIDIGHRRVRVRLLDLMGETIGQAEGASPDRAAPVEDLVQVVTALAQRANDKSVSPGIAVVGVPGAVSPTDQTLSLAEGMPGSGTGLRDRLSGALATDVLLENDVNLAALAELEHTDLNNFVYLSLGHGLGAAIISGGELQPGFRGAAGELSYLPGTNWRTDGVLGASSIATDVAAAGLPPDSSPQEVFGWAREGDARALNVVDATARRLALVCATVALTCDPEAIVLSGAIGANTDLLLDPLWNVLAQDYPEAVTRVIPSNLGENATMRGAVFEATKRLQSLTFTEICRVAPSEVAEKPKGASK